MKKFQKGPVAAFILAILAWLWLVLALPFLTDASCPMFVGFALTGTWLVLAVFWFAVGLQFWDGLTSSRATKRGWIAAGVAGALGVLLAFTHVGFMVRIAMCESALRNYIAQIQPGDGEFLHEPRPVGLFRVDGEENYRGVVFLYTSCAFLNREGIAYMAPEINPEWEIPRHRLRHIYGPWYWFYWKF
jgi:hypothetical protein